MESGAPKKAERSAATRSPIASANVLTLFFFSPPFNFPVDVVAGEVAIARRLQSPLALPTGAALGYSDWLALSRQTKHVT